MSKIGVKQTEEHKRKINTPERARKISETLKRLYKEEKRSCWTKGKKLSKEHKRNIKIHSATGEKSKMWKGGIPKCLDCGIKLGSYKAKRCIYCSSHNADRNKKLSLSMLGKKPTNWSKIGTISIRNTKNNKRKWIKIKEPKEWIFYSKYLWETINSKCEKGYVIHHVNGNCLDDRIENLIKLSKKEHINLHRKKIRKASKAYYLLKHITKCVRKVVD